MKSKASKNASKKNHSKLSNNSEILTITNYNSLKQYIPFIIGILLLGVIFWVYKKYNTNKECFLDQEPVDLLDRIKDNSYLSLPMWSNFLYNYQKGLEETPLTFWKLNRDDNTFKFIGNAISNDVNEITGQYTPTNKKTMLVQGDTKVPESAKLLFQHPYNLITTREKGNDGTLNPVNVYKNIDNLKDIDNRIEQLSEAYKLIIQVKKELEYRFKNKIDYITKKLNFQVSLFGQDNYFIKSEINGKVKLTGTTTFGNGKYNGVRIPLGAKVKLTFNNGTVFTYNGNLDNILNENMTGFNKLTMASVYGQDSDPAVFNKSNFNILGPYGLTKPDNNPPLDRNNPNYKAIGGSVRISRRKGPRPDINYDFGYPFNFVVSDNKNYNAVSHYGKEDIAKYISELISEREIRNDYIDDDPNNISNSVMYVGKINKDTDTFKGMYYLFNSTIGKTQSIIRHPDVDSRGEHHIIWKERNAYDDISFVNKDITTTQDEPMENIIENFRDVPGSGESYTITNPMLDVDTNFINEELVIGDILSPLVTKLDIINTDSKEWGIDLTYITRNDGTSVNINDIYDFNYNTELGLSSNSTMFQASGTGSGTKIDIRMPYFYLNMIFKYPEFIYEGNLKFKEGDKVRNAFSIDSMYFDNKVINTNIHASKRNDRWIFLNAKFNGYRNCHNIKSIMGDGGFLKNVSVSMNISESQLPFKNILNRVLELKLQDLQYFEQTVITMTNKLNNLRSQISAGEYKHLPMKIYRPIAPKYYKSVGDIIFTLNSYSNNNDYIAFEEEPNLQEYACVPEQCVREVREWLPIDKVYEYQLGSKYLALYKNPYLQTFRAVTTPGVLPPGKVEKIVACVDRCKLVDDLIQADNCARTFHKAHKNVSDTFNLDPDNLLNERKSNIYKDKIIEREDRLNTLKEVARRLQVQDDKANMINKAYNRHRLQDLVDKQKVNMHTLVDKLNKDKNKITINIKFDYAKASGTLNSLCNNNSLPSAVCQKLNNILDNTARRALKLDGAERLQYDKKALDALIRSCPTPDMENLFKRSLVESNCGCYFTDEDLEFN